MFKHYLAPAIALAAISISSCNAQNSGFKKLPSGLEYKIVRDEPGIQKPAIGDFMEFHIKSYVHFPKGDSILFDSRVMNNNQPVPFQLTPPQFNGDLAEGLAMLTKGDSAIFRVPLDSIAKAGNQLLPWMKKGEGMKIEYSVAVVSVKTKSQLEEEQKAQSAKQSQVDEKLIQDYLTKNNIKAERSASGLYYKIDNPGGPKVVAGDSVSMNYTGTTLEGVKFDSNTDPEFHHVMPFWFVLGAGQVIRGWDEGISLFGKGGKGTLYIPSTLAYGAQSPSPKIAPNSILVFNVEVVDAKSKH